MRFGLIGTLDMIKAPELSVVALIWLLKRGTRLLTRAPGVTIFIASWLPPDPPPCAPACVPLCEPPFVRTRLLFLTTAVISTAPALTEPAPGLGVGPDPAFPPAVVNP